MFYLFGSNVIFVLPANVKNLLYVNAKKDISLVHILILYSQNKKPSVLLVNLAFVVGESYT